MSINEENPLVSVVIPSYNNEATIVTAINSVFAQSYKDVEVIIVNDGSTDSTDELLREYCSTSGYGSNITYLAIANAGPSNARNIGMFNAKGKYVAFLDADDCWANTKLEKQLNCFEAYPSAAMVGCAFGKKRIAADIAVKVISFKELLFSNYFSTPTVIIKKSVLEKLGVRFNVAQRYSEDYRVWLEIAYSYPVILLNEVLAKNQFEKADYGDHGLSSNLYLMEKGELSNYCYFYKKKYIGLGTLLSVMVVSIAKYFLRVVRSAARPSKTTA